MIISKFQLTNVLCSLLLNYVKMDFISFTKQMFFYEIKNSTCTSLILISRSEFGVFSLVIVLKYNETTTIRCLKIGHLFQNKHVYIF